LIREMQEEAFEASLRIDREKEARKRAEIDAAEAAEQAEKDAVREASDRAAARERDVAAKKEALPAPPLDSYTGSVTRLRFKFPSGQQVDRAFATSDTTVQQLYDFVDVNAHEFGVSADWSLFTAAPRREITPGGSLSLAASGSAELTLDAVGFKSGSERLMVQDNLA
jgi:FAS-associated factor 2